MELDDVVAKDGRVWYHFATTPYQRTDGTWTKLAEWHSVCAVCGAPIFARTPATEKARTTSTSFDLKHCDAHKLSKTEVTAKWQEAIAKSRRAKRAN